MIRPISITLWQEKDFVSVHKPGVFLQTEILVEQGGLMVMSVRRRDPGRTVLRTLLRGGVAHIDGVLVRRGLAPRYLLTGGRSIPLAYSIFRSSFLSILCYVRMRSLRVNQLNFSGFFQ